ncbi:unnamed protein product [Ambrosiozyma monospora]|uniref:Unnamed protein product n=1 Tax=Ambrosiozyma monospora TaxID=43982 RepID=A0A9W7DM92_AMBMO|nr:unnamed protein product [Ambrosiozyma monospora]
MSLSKNCVQRRIIGACVFEMFIFDPMSMFGLSLTKSTPKFVNTLIDMKPRRLFAKHWQPFYTSIKMLDHPISPKLVKMSCSANVAISVNENFEVFSKLEEIYISRVGKNFNLASIRSILQSSMINRVDIIPSGNFFKFSAEPDSQKMLKIFELKIQLKACHVDRLETLKLVKKIASIYNCSRSYTSRLSCTF